jgi:hypothetical protein
MLARIWTGAVGRADGGDYAEYMRTTGMTGYAAIPGNRGASMLRRDANDKTEFVMFAPWDSLDAVKPFAGEDYETAICTAGLRGRPRPVGSANWRSVSSQSYGSSSSGPGTPVAAGQVDEVPAVDVDGPGHGSVGWRHRGSLRRRGPARHRSAAPCRPRPSGCGDRARSAGRTRCPPARRRCRSRPTWGVRAGASRCRGPHTTSATVSSGVWSTRVIPPSLGRSAPATRSGRSSAGMSTSRTARRGSPSMLASGCAEKLVQVEHRPSLAPPPSKPSNPLRMLGGLPGPAIPSKPPNGGGAVSSLRWRRPPAGPARRCVGCWRSG